MEFQKCRARFVVMNTKFFLLFVFISSIVNLSSTTYINVKNYGPLPSSNSPGKSNFLNQHKESDFENNDNLEEEKVPTKQTSFPRFHDNESLSHIKNRKGKQLLALYPRIHHGSYQTSRRGLPFQYGYPYFMMNPSYNGINRYGIMPSYAPSIGKIKGEEEKKGKKTTVPTSKKTVKDTEFEVTAKARVMDTPNSLIQGDTNLEKTINVETSPIQEEKILGRANYFSHRLSIDAETPIHLNNENTLLTNENNNAQQQDFASSSGNITGTRFGVDPNVQDPNPRDCCLFVFLDGSAFYLDDFLEKLTGFYRLMAGTVNGYPHFVARSCRNPNIYGNSCTYIWYSGFGWVVGVGRYIGQTKGVMYTQNSSICPTNIDKWRYLNQDLKWNDNGAISVTCAS